MSSSAFVCLLGSCGLLLASVQAVQGVSVTASQVHSRVSAVVSAGAETLTIDEELPAQSSWEFLANHPANKSAPATTELYGGRKVNINVYYETKCPGCLFFLNRTLEPLWRNQNFRDFLNITMVTYGNGLTIPMKNVSEGYKFWHPDTTGPGYNSVQMCQHGSSECLGNQVTLCVKELHDNEKYMEMIFCMASNTLNGDGEEKATFDCMKKHGVNHHKVRQCVFSPHGNELVTATGIETHALKGRLGTPWVMINNEHAEETMLMNVTLLQQSVCAKASNVPMPCAAFAAKPAKTTEPAAHASPAEQMPDPDFVVFGKDVKLKELLSMEMPRSSQI